MHSFSALSRSVTHSARRALSSPTTYSYDHIHPVIPPRLRKLMRRPADDELEVGAKASGFETPWELHGAAIVERLPVIAPPMTTLEMTHTVYQIMRTALEQSRAKEYPPEWFSGEQFEEGEEEGLVTQSSTPKPGTLEAYEPADSITAADKSGDVRTTERRLADRLYLVVKAKSGGWMLPQLALPQDSTALKETAQDAVNRTLTGCELYWIGNCPAVCHREVLDKQHGKSFGTKTFFYRAQLIAGLPKLITKHHTDWAWLAHDELESYLSPQVATTLLPVLPP